MQVTIDIPDELTDPTKTRPEVSRELLEAYALQGYNDEKLTSYQVGRLLGFETPMQVDAFLKEHGVFLEYDKEDFANDEETSSYLQSLRER